MNKKQSVSASILLFLLVYLAYLNQIPLMLMLTKFKSAMEYDVGPPLDIPWSEGPAHASDTHGERSPNIILIVVDDLGFNDISYFGGGLVGGSLKTPNIDKLAAEGIAFTQSYSGAATCAPSRAMLMTGRYPTRTGFGFTPMPPGMAPIGIRIAASIDDGTPPAIYYPEIDDAKPQFEAQGLGTEELTVAEVLRDRGYQTFHIGKWHLGRAEGMAPHEQGFEQSLLMTDGLYLPEDDPNVVNAKLDFDPMDQFLWASLRFANSFNSGNKRRFKPKGYLTDYWTDESIRIIKANKNRPFFLYLAHWGVHTPLQATREDYEAVGDIKPHRLRVYAAMVRAVDRSVGRIIAALETEGLTKNTIVVFTSDNGGAHYIGLPEVNKPLRGWKMTNFEGGLRVPLFMKWPARIKGGITSAELVSHVDVMPTLAAAAQTSIPESIDIDGLNLLPLATTGGMQDWQRQTLFWQSGHYRSVRHGYWKLQTAERPDAAPRLYNLLEDPSEKNNVASSYPTKLAELMMMLSAHHQNAREPLYSSAIEAPVPLDKTKADHFEDGDEYIYWPN